MKTPFTNRWIALDALGPEDEDAELSDYVSVDLDEPDDEAESGDQAARERALAAPARQGVWLAGDVEEE
jgi:hypothetical protein